MSIFFLSSSFLLHAFCPNLFIYLSSYLSISLSLSLSLSLSHPCSIACGDTACLSSLRNLAPSSSLPSPAEDLPTPVPEEARPPPPLPSEANSPRPSSRRTSSTGWRAAAAEAEARGCAAASPSAAPRPRSPPSPLLPRCPSRLLPPSPATAAAAAAAAEASSAALSATPSRYCSKTKSAPRARSFEMREGAVAPQAALEWGPSSRVKKSGYFFCLFGVEVEGEVERILKRKKTGFNAFRLFSQRLSLLLSFDLSVSLRRTCDMRPRWISFGIGNAGPEKERVSASRREKWVQE